MNPKTNKIWKKMIYLSKKRYNFEKLKFNRIKNEKFIEDENELKKVGMEIFQNFGLSKIKIKLFVDICAAPGVYTNIILNEKENSRGICVSLPPENGGVEFTEIKNMDKVNIFYRDILEKNYKLVLPKKIDFGMASCVSYIFDKKKKSFLNLRLILSSIDIILKELKKKGNFIVNLTMKNINLCFNIIYYLSNYFEKFKLWKSSNVWNHQNTFYFFGYNFKNNYDNNINNIKLNLENFNSDFYNYFLGDINKYKKINNKMNKIYKVRINAYLKL
jgi:23S rRNA U2552 (ribose-2'-O)-methylase RlmE/FtsJ